MVGISSWTVCIKIWCARVLQHDDLIFSFFKHTSRPSLFWQVQVHLTYPLTRSSMFLFYFLTHPYNVTLTTQTGRLTYIHHHKHTGTINISSTINIWCTRVLFCICLFLQLSVFVHVMFVREKVYNIFFYVASNLNPIGFHDARVRHDFVTWAPLLIRKTTNHRITSI